MVNHLSDFLFDDYYDYYYGKMKMSFLPFVYQGPLHK